jgi:hypothetical protein
MTQNTATKQFLTLAEIVKDKENPSVFILNTSKPRGNITFEVADGMGGKIGIKIPATWVPIDITTQAPKESILSNPQFRKLLASQFLAVPSESHMAAIQRKEGYAKEVAKAYNASEQVATELLGASSEARNVIESENVSGFVLNLVNSTDIDESEALNSVNLQADTMTLEDLNYLVNNSKHGKVKQAAAELIAALKA